VPSKIPWPWLNWLISYVNIYLKKEQCYSQIGDLAIKAFIIAKTRSPIGDLAIKTYTIAKTRSAIWPIK
jgi:hypothetical protein